jgi:hypothetical protein
MTMDATPGHLDPHHLDDGILSALLDGDVAGAGADGGPDATAHLSACDRCAGRQAELGAARTALATAPVEALDELTRRRLVAAALSAGADDRAGMTAPGTSMTIGRSRRFQRHPALLGSAAAVLLALLVGIPFVVGDDGGQGETLSAQAPDASREESAGSFLGDLGDLGDRDSLRLRLSGGAADAMLGYSAPQEPGPSPAAGAPAAAPVPVAGPAGSGSLSGPPAGGRSSGIPTTTAPSEAAKSSAENSATDSREPSQPPPGQSDGFSSNEQYAADRDRVDTDTCVAALLDGPARGGRLTRSGVGTYQGRPAIVASFELEGGTVAFIADRSGCAVLDRFPI